MALHASRMTQDQNFSVHFDGAKINGSTVRKTKGALGARKALNDISNSAKPSALQPSRKQNLKNIIPISEDLGFSKKALQVPAGGKSGRKALSDLTNSVRPSGQQQQGLKNRSQVKKPITIAEDVPYSFAEEGFLHNHDECVKLQKKTFDFDEFLVAIGHDKDASFQSVSAHNPLPEIPKEDDPFTIFEMEEIEDPALDFLICGSPKSPKLSSMSFLDYEPSFTLAESPKRVV